MALWIQRCEMKNLKILCHTLILLFCSLTSLEAQDDSSFVGRFRRTIESKEPGWQYIGVIQTGRVRVVPSEKTLIASVWRRISKGDNREGVDINVYEVESPEEAAKWLSLSREARLAVGSQVTKYKKGDEAYLSEYKYQSGSSHELHFRKGKIVVEVRGESLRNVERFAEYVLTQLTAI